MDKIIIESKKQGAELTSIKYKNDEKLHQGKEFWNRHAPILFPIVGQIKNGKTIINKKEYEMSQHGFARDMEFEEIEKNENIHSYILKSNSKTLEKYPFKFELHVKYIIQNNILKVQYKVINKDNCEIQFGLGAHPAFICNYTSNEYELEFNKNEENIEFLKLENGLISKEKGKNLLKDNNKIELYENTFKSDAIILKNIQSNIVTLKNKKTKNKLLEFDFTGFPYLGIWSKKGAPFVCIEPWFNTADKIDTDGILKNKENILKLKPKEIFVSEYKVKF